MFLCGASSRMSLRLGSKSAMRMPRPLAGHATRWRLFSGWCVDTEACAVTSAVPPPLCVRVPDPESLQLLCTAQPRVWGLRVCCSCKQLALPVPAPCVASCCCPASVPESPCTSESWVKPLKARRSTNAPKLLAPCCHAHAHAHAEAAAMPGVWPPASCWRPRWCSRVRAIPNPACHCPTLNTLPARLKVAALERPSTPRHLAWRLPPWPPPWPPRPPPQPLHPPPSPHRPLRLLHVSTNPPSSPSLLATSPLHPPLTTIRR